MFSMFTDFPSHLNTSPYSRALLSTSPFAIDCEISVLLNSNLVCFKAADQSEQTQRVRWGDAGRTHTHWFSLFNLANQPDLINDLITINQSHIIFHIHQLFTGHTCWLWRAMAYLKTHTHTHRENTHSVQTLHTEMQHILIINAVRFAQWPASPLITEALMKRL